MCALDPQGERHAQSEHGVLGGGKRKVKCLVELKNVCLSFDGAHVLKNINLRIEDGERVAVMGPSGRGKTSLLRVIAGIQKPDSGEVINTAKKTAYMFQEPRLLPWYSAMESVAFTIEGEDSNRIALQWLDKFGLSAYAGKKPDELSAGMRQRVALARALAPQADLVILDEPFKAIDALAREKAIQVVSSGVEGATLVLVTHRRENAEALGCRILNLDGLGNLT